MGPKLYMLHSYFCSVYVSNAFFCENRVRSQQHVEFVNAITIQTLVSKRFFLHIHKLFTNINERGTKSTSRVENDICGIGSSNKHKF